jgi:hypothetical protein
VSALRKAAWTVLTAVWTIGLLVVMQHSQPEVMLVLWAGGEAVVSGMCFLTTEPVHFVPAAPYPDRSKTREQLERERREHQEQQWEQARMAWLMTPEQQQKPPPTDSYRGF